MPKPSDIHESENAHQDRPSLPESYGVDRKPEGMLTWDWVDEQLRRSRSYWVATTRPDGRPQTIPVWGVWFDGTFYFGTSTGSRKARNLAVNPAIAVHLESGDDAVILEGMAEVMTDAALFERYADAYDAKYAVRPGDGTGSDAINYAVRPRVVLAWLEQDFLNTPTRWTFARD
jgi:hypothetical protein